MLNIITSTKKFLGTNIEYILPTLLSFVGLGLISLTFVKAFFNIKVGRFLSAFDSVVILFLVFGIIIGFLEKSTFFPLKNYAKTLDLQSSQEKNYFIAKKFESLHFNVSLLFSVMIIVSSWQSL